jgi:sec-independent protein translocase protein TatA
MGSFSIWHWLVVLLVILLLFGSGKISGLMGDLAKGIKSFKQNMKEDQPDASMEAQAPPAGPQQPAGSISGPGTAQGARPAETAASGSSTNRA